MIFIPVETHAIILTPGEDVATELLRNLKSGNLLTKLTEETLKRMIIENIRYVRLADPQETEHHNRTSIWIEATISF